MKYIYRFNLLNLNIIIEIPFSLNFQESGISFFQEANSYDSYDLLVRFYPVDSIDTDLKGYPYELRTYCRTPETERIYFRFVSGQPYYACMIQPYEGNIWTCEYLPEYESEMCYAINLYNLIGLENILRKYHGFLLHSSLIDWNGTGIVFTAPSGTGKSTQAALWQKYEHVEILNGDRSGICKQDGIWKAYGLPVAGSSGIYRNEYTELKCIVILEQAKTNTIERLRPSQAFMHLHNQSMVHYWDRESNNKVSDYLIEISKEIPAFKLSCLPDKGAVELLKKTLEGIV